jgi:hypothetical protein
MREHRFYFALLLTAASAPLLANWGSTAGGSVATGSFHAFGTAQVEMQREDLRILREFRDFENGGRIEFHAAKWPVGELPVETPSHGFGNGL